MPPYVERRLSGGSILREFSRDVQSSELEWHMDRQDRRITVLEGNGWKLQLEQGLPLDLVGGKTYLIPHESWHRVIKGTSALKIIIEENYLRDHNTLNIKESLRMKDKKIEILPSHDIQVNEVWSRLGSEVAILESRGHTVRELDEYVFEQLIKMERRTLTEQAGFDMFRGLKKMAADKIADVLGVPQGFLRNIITNFMAGLGIADLRLMLQPGSCGKIVTKLAAAIQGAIVDTVMKSIGLSPENFLTIAITEAIKSGFVENGPFVKKASEVICKVNISEILPGGISSFFGKGKKAAEVAAPAKV